MTSLLKNNPLVTLCLALSTITLASCDALFDSAIDCLDVDGPTLSPDSVAAATLNQVYQQQIVAAVNNEPRDDRFRYNFSILEGSLPPGISREQAGRTLVLSGTATELGMFSFVLNVEVDDGLSAFESGLCFRNRQQRYWLAVNQDKG